MVNISAMGKIQLLLYVRCIEFAYEWFVLRASHIIPTKVRIIIPKTSAVFTTIIVVRFPWTPVREIQGITIHPGEVSFFRYIVQSDPKTNLARKVICKLVDDELMFFQAVNGREVCSLVHLTAAIPCSVLPCGVVDTLFVEAGSERNPVVGQ